VPVRWDDAGEGPSGLSSYTGAEHGPEPIPPWVITDDGAEQRELGVLKTGKEADVHLVERRHGERVNLLAAKRYRGADHRLFHRDAGYTEGRRVRRSRETRAMATRTDFGRALLSGQWAFAEFEILGRLWSAGASVPYPVQLAGSELMLEFIGEDDGVAAPRLAEIRPGLHGQPGARELFDQVVAVMAELARAGLTHGDLSPYNILVHRGRVYVIDLPQALDVVINPQGFAFLHRDCVNVCRWFVRHGLPADVADPEAVFAALLSDAGA
jgi:RIO kinase 1